MSNNSVDMTERRKEIERLTIEIGRTDVKNPVLLDLLNQRGLAYLSINENRKAIEDFSKGIEINPQKISLWKNRGKCYYRLKEFQNAIHDSSKCLEISPKDSEYWNTRGVYFSSNSEEIKAIEDFSKAIELNPQNRLYWKNRGSTYFDLKEYRNAISDSSKSLEIDPEDADCWNLRGDAHSFTNEPRKAIGDYTKAIELKPKVKLYRMNRGECYFSLKEYNNAIVEFSNLLEMFPEDDDCLNKRGCAYHRMKEERKAIEDYSKAIDFNPQNSIYWKNRGNSHYNLKEYQSAIRDYDECLRLDPKDSNAFNGRGVCFSVSLDHRKAVEDFSKAIEITPSDSPVFWRNRGVSLRIIGEFERSIVDFTKAYENGYKLTDDMRALKDFSSEDGERYQIGRFFFRRFFNYMKKEGKRRLSDQIPAELLNKTLKDGYEIHSSHASTPVQQDNQKDFAFAYIAKYIAKSELLMKNMIIQKQLWGDGGELFDKMMIKEFSNSVEDVSGTVSFVVQNKMFYDEGSTLVVKLDEGGNVLHIPPYFSRVFPGEEIVLDSKVKDFILSNLGSDISFCDIPDLFCRVLSGFPFEDSNVASSVVVLYSLFKTLRMFDHIYILLKYTIPELSLVDAIRVLNKCSYSLDPSIRSSTPPEDVDSGLDNYEKGKEVSEEPLSKSAIKSLKTSISVALFNNLCGRMEEIESQPRFEKFLDGIGILYKLKDASKVEDFENFFPFTQHDELRGELSERIDECLSFRDLYKKILTEVYSNKDDEKSRRFCTNLRLRTQDMGENEKEYLTVHKEVLCLRSQFFSLMFKFPGIEASEEVVLVEKLSKASVKCLLDVIYKQDGSSLEYLSMKELFSLLVFSEMYSEILLKCFVLRQIDKKMVKSCQEEEGSGGGGFSLLVLEIGYHLNDLPSKMKDLMICRWEHILRENGRKDDILKLIGWSVFTENLANRTKEDYEDSNQKKKMKDEDAKVVKDMVSTIDSLRKRKREDDENEEGDSRSSKRRRYFL